MGEHHAPPLRIATPDAAFRISREERGRLRDGIDADALERFLGMVHPSYRSRILDTFMAREGRDGVTLFDRVPDPVLQRVLDEVWAPRRQMITPELAARAEQNLRARSEPMEVLLVAAIPGSTADAVVVHAGGGRDRVILRERAATPSLLVMATERLVRSRMDHGLSPQAEHRFELSGAGDYDGIPPELLPRQRDLLDGLRASPSRQVPGLGNARSAAFQVIGAAGDRSR
jgi:hypothetical protein